MDEISWNKILSEVKPISASIEGLLRLAKPFSIEGNSLKIGVCYKFHKDKLEENKTKQMLESVIEKVFQKQLKLECQLTEPPKENILSVEEIFS